MTVEPAGEFPARLHDSAISNRTKPDRDAILHRNRRLLTERGEQTNRNLAALDDQLTANVATLSEPIVRAVEVERGCSMLIGRGTILHLGDASLDITPAVIARMNAAPAAGAAGR